MRTSRALLLGAVIITAASLSPAWATTLRRASLKQLVIGSDVVVVATAMGQVSYWDGGRIKTRIQLRADDIWRGPASLSRGATIEMVTMGGVVGDIGQSVHGAISLRKNEQAVLCLKQTDTGRYRSVGMAQGLFRILSTPQGAGDPIVKQATEDLHLIGAPLTKAIPTTLQALRRAVMEVDREQP